MIHVVLGAILTAVYAKIIDEHDDDRMAEALTPPPFKAPTEAEKDAGVTWQELNKPDARSIHKDSK